MKPSQKILKYLLYIKWFITEDVWYYLGFRNKHSKLYRCIKMARLTRFKLFRIPTEDELMKELSDYENINNW